MQWKSVGKDIVSARHELIQRSIIGGDVGGRHTANSCVPSLVWMWGEEAYGQLLCSIVGGVGGEEAYGQLLCSII